MLAFNLTLVPIADLFETVPVSLKDTQLFPFDETFLYKPLTFPVPETNISISPSLS